MKQTLLVLLLLFPACFFAQDLKGRVIDQKTKQGVLFATIKTSPTTGAISDEDGNFVIKGIGFPLQLIVSADDYLTDTIEVTSNEFLKIELITAIQGNISQLGPVVIAASRRKQSVEEIPISIEVIDANLVRNKGITDLEAAVDQAPGAYTMDGQVSIRGGSGFSYGAGSRVLVLWNEVPLLSGDAGDAKFNSIPIEQASQIEVIKGATSVLYGSGALNGIVSLIEQEPTSEMKVTAKLQGGLYDDPKRESLKWWTTSPTYNQADFTFSKKFERFGLNLGAAGFSTDGYREGEVEDRARLNGTLFWSPKDLDRLKFSLGWNAQMQKTGNFIIWQSDTFAYQPYGGADTSIAGSTLTYNRGTRISIDPSIKFYDKKFNRHTLRTRYYFVDNANFTNTAQSSKSQVYYADYQFQKKWKGLGLVLTTGATTSTNKINSYLFGDHNSFNAAIYGQLEKKWKKWDISFGTRMEYFEQDGEALKTKYFNGRGFEQNAVRPIFRSGIHYAVAKYTHLRASFGQGIRYPTVAERYTQTSVGSLNIFPNPNLQAETGWAGEIGVKQGLKIGEWKGFIDVAGFINSYQNMMEFTLGVYNPDSIPLSGNPNNPGYIGKWVGFRAENAEAAQISGFEASVNGTGKIGPIKVQTLFGYTYMNPVSKNYKVDYRETFSNDSVDILKYRFNHLAKADLQLEFKGFSIGGSTRMNSFMVNIDKAFEDGILGQQILPGLKQYRLDNDGPTIVFDARIGYEFREKYKVNFIINNIANAEYMTRPGDMQAPRCFILQLSLKL